MADTIYEKEPLEIQIPVPGGTYEVTLYITATEDTEFSVQEQTQQFALDQTPIKKGEKRDFTFPVTVSGEMYGVGLYIFCDEGLTAAATVSPIA